MANSRRLLFVGAFLAGSIIWQYQNVNSKVSDRHIATQRRFNDINTMTTTTQPRIDQPNSNQEKMTQYSDWRTLNKTQHKIQKIDQRKKIDINEGNIVTQETSLIYGIYIDYRSTSALVHIMMFRKCYIDFLFSMELILHRLNKTDVSLRNFKLESDCPQRYEPECHWIQHHVYFKIPSHVSSNTIFTGATLIGKRNKFVKVPPSKIRTIPRTVNPEILLAVCVSPLYLTADWFRLVQFVEIWRSHGAEKIIIYYQSVSATVMRFLQAYQTEGIVEIVPWSLLPTDKNGNFDPNTELYRAGHMLAENDCMYRTMEMAKFVAKVDIDEFIIPHSGTLVNFLVQTLQRRSNIGMLEFQPRSFMFAQHPIRNPNDLINLKDINFSYLTSSLHDYNLKLVNQQPKNIILPHRTKKVAVHRGKLLAGYVTMHNVTGAAYLHERYDLQKPDRPIVNSSYPLSATAAANIQKNYNSFMEKYFSEIQEFAAERHILPVADACRLEIASKHICRSTILCYDSVRNMTNWVFATKNSFLVF